MRIRIQIYNITGSNKLPDKEFSWIEKDKTDCSKVETMEVVQIYLHFLVKLQLLTVPEPVPCIFSDFPPPNSSLLDPDRYK